MHTEIICVRHGETSWNQQSKFQGHQDLDLNKKGYIQAEKLADYLVDREIDLIYSSDLKRSRATAQEIASHHNLEVIRRTDLREINFGQWEGLTFGEISKQFPEITEKWTQDPLAITPPGAEKLVDFQERIVKELNKIITEESGSKIIVVAHGGCIKVWLTHLLGMSLRDYWKLNVDLASISVIKIFAEDPVLSLLNYTDHLIINN